jgi:predicted ester cyclase
MSLEDNKAVVRRYLELFEQPDADRFAEVIHDDLVAYYPDGSVAFRGAEAWIDSERDRGAAELSVEAEELLAEGDLVACRYRLTVAYPNGRRVSGSGTKIYRIRDGKIVEIAGHDHNDVLEEGT